MVERPNCTLKRKIHEYLTLSRYCRYIDSLGDMVAACNHTRHSSTGFASVKIDRSNAEEVFFRLCERNRYKDRAAFFGRGDYVRITKAKGVFDRSYTPNWTREIFVADKVLDWNYPTTYTLVDLANEPVMGTIYCQEQQLVEKPTVFNVECVICWKKRGCQCEALVKWEGYTESMNGWVPRVCH